jgi:hypothetical protein
LKETLVPTFGIGRFVAIANGQIIADAADFTELRSRLAEMGKEPAKVLIVQAGVDYPEKAIIFSMRKAQ